MEKRKGNILYYSLVDWKWIKQRPHFICIYLNKYGFVVDYAYPVIIARSFFLKHYYVKNVDYSNILKIKVRQFPKESSSSLIRSINKRYRYWQLKRLIRCRQYQAIIITHPVLYSEAIIQSHCPVIFEMMDDYLSFENMDKDEYLKKEKQICKDANKVIVSSAALKRLLIGRYPDVEEKIVIINNAFDLEAFKAVSRKVVGCVQSRGKKLVYIGTIGNWIDYSNLIKYANLNPRDFIQLVGPLENLDHSIESEIKKVNNIILTGPVEHQDIRSYISNGDIMLIPFVPNLLIQCVDPVKIYEYIYFNKPIVSSYWPELDKFEDFVEFYYPDEKDSFSSAIAKVTIKKVDEEKYRKFVENNSWDIRVIDYTRVVEQAIVEYKKTSGE